MAVMVRANFPDIFTDLLAAIDTVYLQSRDLDESKAPWKTLFAVKKSNRQFENVTGFTGFATLPSVGEAEDYTLRSVAQLYDLKFTHTKFGMAWSVSEEMEDDDKFELVANLARAAARSARFTKEVDVAKMFNNAGTGGTTPLIKSADGGNILSTHTLENGSTFNNLVTTDFGVAAAQTMFNFFATLTDDKGIRIHLQPSYLVAHPSMRWVVGETLRSQFKPATSDNDINVLAEENLTEVYWPEITDTNSWFAVVKPSDMNGNGLRLYDRQPWTTSNDFKIENTTMLSVIRSRWSRGCIDWRAMYGSYAS